MNTTTYTIDADASGHLDGLLKKLATRAKRLKVAPPVWTFGEVYKHEERDPRTKELITRLYRTVEISTEVIKLAGWRLIATLDHTTEAGVVVRGVPGEDVPTTYRDALPTCDHCHTTRKRLETFVVRHDDDSLKAVGRNCVHDFLGMDPTRFIYSARIAGLVNEAAEECAEWSGGREFIELERYLAYVAMTITEAGWVSRSKAREDGREFAATADLALSAMWDAGKVTNGYTHPTADESHYDRARKGIEWARDLGADGSDLNDYAHNAHVVGLSEGITLKNIGIAASIIFVAERHAERIREEAARREAEKDSDYIGTVGKREEFTLTLLGTREFESDFGVTTMHKFADPEGNIAIWYASSGTLWNVNAPTPEDAHEWAKPGAEVEEGETVTVRATVKAHTEYKGTKNTKLTRVATFKPKKKKGKAA